MKRSLNSDFTATPDPVMERPYTVKELDRILCSFVPGACTKRKVTSDNDIHVGDIVTKIHDPKDEQRPFVVYKSWHQGNKLCARNGNGGEENVSFDAWYVWTRATPVSNNDDNINNNNPAKK
jgi:hypothetical protein